MSQTNSILFLCKVLPYYIHIAIIYIFMVWLMWENRNERGLDLLCSMLNICHFVLKWVDIVPAIRLKHEVLIWISSKLDNTFNISSLAHIQFGPQIIVCSNLMTKNFWTDSIILNICPFKISNSKWDS